MPPGRIFLYHRATSPACARVRITLDLEGALYKEAEIDLDNPSVAATFAHLSPLKELPCLELDGLSLAGSISICEYLVETIQHRPLMPSTAADRAFVRQVMVAVDTLTRDLENHAELKDLPAEHQRRTSLMESFYKIDRLLERQAGSFVAGGKLSLADVFLYPALRAAADLGLAVNELTASANVLRHLNDIDEFRF